MHKHLLNRVKYHPRNMTFLSRLSMDLLIILVTLASSCHGRFSVPFLKPTLLFALPTLGEEEGDGPNKLIHRSPDSLQNSYWVLRHGQSEANVARVIASSPEIATKKYGLSDLGKEQAAKAGDDIVKTFRKRQEAGSQEKAVLLLTSDLLRAKETAQIVRTKLEEAGIPLYDDFGDSISAERILDKGLIMETRLRERWFGDWDETSDTNYYNVWKDDIVDPNHTLQGVESVNDVVTRTTQCIVEWDNRVQNCFIICVAHGDVLQILQTAFRKMDGSLHRTLEHLETATLRHIELAE